LKTGFKNLETEKFYRDYLYRLDARLVLERYDAENCRDIPGDKGTTEIVHSCLLDSIERHHSNGDRNPSASCNVEKKKYVCWAYWGGDLFHLIMKMEKKDDLHDIIPVVSDLLTGSVQESDTFRDQLDRLFVRDSVYSIELPEYHSRILKPWMFSHPYLREERGVSLEASSRLKLGWNQDTNRIVFPHFWMGKLVGWQERAIPPRERWPGSTPQEPKYKSTGGFPKAETLYGYDTAVESKAVVVCESPMSVAKAASLGCSVPFVATFGAKVSNKQIDLLKDFSRVYVWMDNDSRGTAGQYAERRIVKGLWRHTEVKVVDVEKDKDPADYTTHDELYSKLENSIPAFLKIPEYT
jgi:hypothetical protein